MVSLILKMKIFKMQTNATEAVTAKAATKATTKLKIINKNSQNFFYLNIDLDSPANTISLPRYLD